MIKQECGKIVTPLKLTGGGRKERGVEEWREVGERRKRMGKMRETGDKGKKGEKGERRGIA
jgi:hypothetical protein